MLQCPKCQGSLRFAESIGLHGAIVCPHCSSELKLNRWVQFLEVIVLMTGMNLCDGFLRARGVSALPAVLGASGISIGVTILLHMGLDRYHVKPRGLSITHTE
jgi:hypothetical protein